MGRERARVNGEWIKAARWRALLRWTTRQPSILLNVWKKYIGADTSKLQMMKNANIAAKQRRETHTKTIFLQRAVVRLTIAGIAIFPRRTSNYSNLHTNTCIFLHKDLQSRASYRLLYFDQETEWDLNNSNNLPVEKERASTSSWSTLETNGGKPDEFSDADALFFSVLSSS